MTTTFDAVVFDLDGTLVDTAPDLCAHLNAVMAGLARPGFGVEDVRLMIGDGARTMLERGLAASGGVPDGLELDALFGRFLERYAAAPQRFGALYAGVMEVLEGLARTRTRLGVCTNKAQAPTDRLLAEVDLARFFPVVIGGDRLAVRKPDPRHLLAVLEALGAEPARAVMVGDSRNDVLAARAAGLASIVVSFGYTPIPPRDLGADLVIDHFAELPAALARLALDSRRAATL